MNKDGFTLIELIVTITLIGLMALVVGIGMVNVTNKNKDSQYTRMKEDIVNATRSYVEGNELRKAQAKASGSSVLLSTLIEDGLLRADIKDPRNGELVDKRYYVRVTFSAQEFKYEYKEQVLGS